MSEKERERERERVFQRLIEGGFLKKSAPCKNSPKISSLLNEQYEITPQPTFENFYVRTCLAKSLDFISTLARAASQKDPASSGSRTW